MNKQYFTKSTFSKVAVFAGIAILLSVMIFYFVWSLILPQLGQHKESSGVELQTYINEKYGFVLDYPRVIDGEEIQIIEGERDKAGYFDVRMYYQDEMLDNENKKVKFDNSLVGIIVYPFNSTKAMHEEDVKTMIDNFSEQYKEQWPGICLKFSEETLPSGIKAFRNVTFNPLSSSCSSFDFENSILYDIEYYIPDYERKQVISIRGYLFGVKNEICLNDNFTLKPVSEIQNQKECGKISDFEHVISSFRFIKK